MKNKYLPPMLYLCSVIALSVLFNQNALGGTPYVFCYGIKNSADPLNDKTVKGVWAVDPNSIRNAAYGLLNTPFNYGSYYQPSGKWGNSNYFTGTIGDGGWMNYYRLASGINMSAVMQACKAAFLNPNIVDSSYYYTSNYLNSSSIRYPLAGSYRYSPFSAADINNGLINILPMASDSLFQYPIITNSKYLSYLSKNGLPYTNGIIDNAPSGIIPSTSNFFNFDKIHTLSQLAQSAYFVDYTPLSKYLFGGFTLFKVMTPKGENSSVQTGVPVYSALLDNNVSFAVAAKNTISKEIIISYKGTDLNDGHSISSDIQLMLDQDGVAGSYLANYISNAYNFYRSIKNDPSNAGYTIILTGHSLGGYIATQVGVRTGEIVRIFSSPSNYLTTSKFKLTGFLTANTVAYIPLQNVINFARSADPVVNLSQTPWSNPVNSTVYFPTGKYLNPLDQHYLTIFIPDIFSNYKKSYSLNAASLPIPLNSINKKTFSYMYLHPGTTIMPLNDVLETNVNFSGEFP